MDDDQSMQEDLNAAIALSLEGGAEWARDYAAMEPDQEEPESMQLAGSPPIASFMAASAGLNATSSQNPPSIPPPTNRFSTHVADSAQTFPSGLNHLWMMGPMQAQPTLGMQGLPHLAQSMQGVLSGNVNEAQLAPFLGTPLMSMLEANVHGVAESAASDQSGDGSWYCMQPDGRWQAYDAAISTAIDAAFRTAEGGSIDVEIEGRRFAGTMQLLRQYSDGTGEERSMPLPVRRFTQEEAYRRAAAVFFGHMPMVQGWPGMGQGQPPRKQLDGLVCAGGQTTLPRTAEEWRAAVDRIAARLSTRPFLSSYMDEVQRSLHVLFEGKKLLKSRSTVLRRGDTVVSSEDGMQGRRGVVEGDLGDGAYLVKWSGMGAASEARRAEGRFLSRPSSSQPHSIRMLNLYLLQKAIPTKESRVVEDLLSQGADPNSIDDGGSPALALAVTNKCPLPLLQALLLAGADPDAAGPTGSPLQIAVRNQDVDAVECLLDNGADATSVDTSPASGCLEAIAEMMQRHKAGVLREEARAALEEETLARLLPLVLDAAGALPDSHGVQAAMSCLAHLVDRAAPPLLHAALVAAPADAPGAGGLAEAVPGLGPSALALCSLLQHAEDSESLDLVFTVLKLVQSLVDKVPEAWGMLGTGGLVRWMEQLSNAKQLKHDVQAGLMSSRGGRIKDKHVSKLASDVLSKMPPAPAPAPHLIAQLHAIAAQLRAGSLEAYGELAGFLRRHRVAALRKGLVRAQHFHATSLPAALLHALTGGGGKWDPRGHWAALAAAVRSADGGEGDVLASLVRPLIELVSSQSCWALNSSGSDDLGDLSRPIRVELAPRPARNGSKARRHPPISLNVEPLCRIQDLEEHVIRTVRPPPEYVDFCFDLVGAVIDERPLRSAAPVRRARVVSFSLQPAAPIKSPAPPAPAPASAPRAIELDPSTLAGCLALASDPHPSRAGSATVVCNKKGSPAGTVQANRAFSEGLDGPVAYFEVTVKKRGPSGAIGVGLAKGSYSKTKMPGWEPVSHAWHGDDGCTFNSCGSGNPFSTPWNEGDVIGCGIDFDRKAVFFTRNGSLQGVPFRGVDICGLVATLGFQTKGETVSVTFTPPFVYDLKFHELSQPQVAIHVIRYEDSGLERHLNLGVREYGIVSMPCFGEFGNRVRSALSRLKARCDPTDAIDAMAALLGFLKGLDALPRSAEGIVIAGEQLQRLSSREGGCQVLEAVGFVRCSSGDGMVLPEPLRDDAHKTLLNLLQEAEEATRCSEGDAMKVESNGDGEAKRDQTVMITIPEGFPPELFFEEVEDALRQALSVADPLVAPASGHVGDAYRWPDRGFDHEEAWYEFLMSSLADKQTGAIARGQTRYEAETLCTRLANVVQCEIITDDSEDFTLRAREVKRVPGAAGANAVMVGDRVQVMETSGGEWVMGTVLDIDQGMKHGVQCDDGLWLPAVSQEMVRSIKSLGAGRGRGGRMELHYDMYGHDHRILEQMAAQAMHAGLGLGLGRVPADLKRTFSCFEVGDINRDGYTAPKRRVDVWDGSPLPPLSTLPMTAGARKPKRLRCSFCVASTPSSEMLKIKSSAQLTELLQGMSGGSFGAILFIDAQSRPPSGQSWPRHIHSASTLVKELAQRFAEGLFVRALSGSIQELLGKFGLQPGFPPTIMLLLAGEVVAAWQQQAKSESMWLPCHPPSDRGASPAAPGEAPGPLWRTVHRNEFVSVLERLIHDRPHPPAPASAALAKDKSGSARSCGGLRAGGAMAAALNPESSIHECMLKAAAASSAAASEGGKLQSLVLQFGVEVEDAGSEGEAMQQEAAADARDKSGAADGAADDGAWWDEADGPDERTREALALLSLLHARFAAADGPAAGPKGDDAEADGARGERDGGGEAAEKLWRSEGLTRRLSCQLNDALAVASGALPRWCHALPRRCPALFSVDARRRLLGLTAFGTSHTVYRLQEAKVAAARARMADRMRQHQQRLARAREAQDMEGIARATDEVDEAERRVYSVRIGAIASDLARVARGSILDNAARLLAYHSPQRHLLEVQFHGEDGFGTGVTQNFYEAVCAALQRRAANRAVPMWIPDGRPDAGPADADAAHAYLSNPEGLFPQPLPADHPSLPAVCDLFLLLGRLFGKACRDRFTVPLPLHPHFFEVLTALDRPDALGPLALLHTFGRPVDAIAPSDDWTPMDLLRALSTVWEEVEAAAGRCQDEGERRAVVEGAKGWEFMGQYLNRTFECTLGDFLEQSHALMTDPLTHAVLVSDESGGAARLTVERLGEYLAAVAASWFGSAIRHQMQAFRRGLADALPLSSLPVLLGREWSVMLCGERRIEWDREALVQHLKLVSNEQGAKYHKESAPFQLLVAELLRMSNHDRARFLDFVTACPRLPPGGLASLAIEIAPGAGPTAYPRSRTCTKLMWLPAYETQEQLSEKLYGALANSKEGGFHEHNT